MKKVLLWFLVVVFAVSMVFIGAGCKGTASETTAATEATTTAAGTTAAQTTDAATTVAEEPYTIQMWDFQNAENWTNAYNEIFDLFKKDHPNISFDRKAQSFADGEALLKAAALSGNIPDILNLWAGEILFSFIDAGLIENLEPYMTADADWWSWVQKPVLADPALRDRSGKGIWWSPVDVYSEMSLYFKDISKQYELADPPLKISDFTAAGEKLKGSDLIPIGTGILDPGMFRELFLLFVSQQLGDGIKALNMYQQAERGEISWNNDEFKNALNAINALNQLHSKDALTIDQQAAGYQRLYTKKTWYEWMCGSWMLGDAEKQLAADVAAGNLGIAPYPACTDSVQANFTVSGTGCVYSLSAKSPRKEIVLEFLKFLNSPTVTPILLKNSIFPAGPVENPESIVSPFFAQYITEVSKLQVSPYPIGVVPEVTNEFQTNLQNMFSGEITPDEVLANMDAAAQAK